MRARVVSCVLAILTFVGLTIITAGTAQAAPNLRTETPMQSALLAEKLVNQFGISIGKPSANWEIVTQVATSPCGHVDPINTMEFCEGDKMIRMGLAAVRELKATHYAVPGEAAAHEYGHYLQYLAGSQDYSENQADCVGGAFLAWVNRHLGLGLGVNDLPGLTQDLASISNWGDPGDPHGTFVDRSSAVVLGFTVGIRGCNGYDPAHPLV